MYVVAQLKPLNSKLMDDDGSDSLNSLSLYSAHDETWPHLESDKSPELFTMPTCIYSQSVALRFE